MTLYATSRVFEAARKTKSRLLEQSWPPHPNAGTVPQVALCEPSWDDEFEIVWVVPEIGDDSEITWRSSPNGRDEVFDILIRVSSEDADEDALLDRIEQLADVVQRAFYDDNTEATAPSERILPLDISQAVKLEGVGQVSFMIVTAPRDGFRAFCDIRYRLAFRI
jgi:hypothetical protein